MAAGVREEVGYIAPIEGLRGIAVLWVLAFHYVIVRTKEFADDPWIRLVDSTNASAIIVRNGYLGVDLFFLITGFLLTLPWFRHAEQGLPPPATRDFYRRRAHRILPAYYVQLIFLFLVCLPLLREMTFWKTDLAFYLVNFAAHVTMLFYTTPVTSASLSLNGALWTLALETQYYLLLPLLAPLFVRAPRITAGVMFAIALAWHWAALHDLKPLVDIEMAIGTPWMLPESTIRHLLVTQVPGYFAHFAAGILCGRAWLHWRRAKRIGHYESAAWLTAIAIAALVLYLIHAPGGVLLGEHTWVLIPISMGVLMLALVSRGLVLGEFLLGNRPLRFVGRISYSIYLYHLPLLLLWNKFAPRDLGWWTLPIYVSIVFTVGWVSYRFVELRHLKARN